MNDLITIIKERCVNDGFLGWLHLLMLMDDTVILATTRERFIEKMAIVYEFCDNNRMGVNNGKTKFMVLNGDEEDKAPVAIVDNVISYSKMYMYLGSIFVDDCNMNSDVENHARDKSKQLDKLSIFLHTNVDFPFCVKQKVVTAAFNAAILYGAETWTGACLKPIETLYMRGIKLLLGVRISTSHDCCLLELGMPPLQALVQQRQFNFLSKTILERQDLADDPFMHVMHLTRRHNRPLARKIDLLLSVSDHVTQGVRALQERVRQSPRTRARTYRELNPQFVTHPFYNRRDVQAPEYMRLSWTRFRLSSHNLRVETGRWSRTLRENRLCQCGSVQDEAHVLCFCRKTQFLRDRHDLFIDFPDILHSEEIDVLRYVHDVFSFDHR